MMRISEPRNARSRRTRHAIQAAAFELLRSEGAAAVTMEAVAAHAGCSRRALYLHFRSRAELFVSLIDFINEVEGIAQDRVVLDEAPDSVARLRGLGVFLGTFHVRIAPIIRAVERVRHTDDAAARVWEEAMEIWRASCLETCTMLREEGHLPERFETLDDAADLMWSLMSPDLMRWLMEDRGWSAEKYGHHMGELFVAAFAKG